MSHCTVLKDIQEGTVNVQFKKGVLELCVLVLIDDRDYYGYELVQDISRNIDISEGTIYPLLRRLSREGNFETYLRESEGGPPRKYYRITERGRETARRIRAEWEEFLASVDRILKGEEES